MEVDFVAMKVLLADCVDFLHSYSWLYNFSNVRFWADNVPNSFPSEWHEFLTRVVKSDFSLLQSILLSEETPIEIPSFVKDFVRKRNQLAENFSLFISKAQNFAKNDTCKKGLTPKKCHEVEQMSSHIIDMMMEQQDFDFLVDVGSGVGHLDRILAQKMGEKRPIICIESHQSHVDSADLKCDQNSDHITNVVATLDDQESSQLVIEQKFLNNKTNGMMLGLHTCGDLTLSMLKWFCSSEKFSSILVVSCCYHKMSSFPWSRYLNQLIKSPLKSHFALRLGSQERFSKWKNQSQKEHEKHEKQFGYRTLLELFAKQNNLELKRTKRRCLLNKTKNFDDFLKVAQERFNLDVDEKMVQKMYEEFSEEKFGLLESVTGLQAFLQYLIEMTIVCDRLLYLHENGLSPTAIELFDENLSPRCVAISCFKA